MVINIESDLLFKGVAFLFNLIGKTAYGVLLN